ncbi:5358_t:CDS:2, partial [Racocetra persica]
VENIKLKQDKEDIEVRFAKLEQSNKEKTDLIAKLEWDVLQIKQASVTSQSIISPSIKNHSGEDDSIDSHSLESKTHQNLDLSLDNQNTFSTELEKPMLLPLLCNANTVTNGHDREEIIPSPLLSDAKTVTNGHNQNNVYVNSVNISEVFESDDQIVENLIQEMSHDHTQSVISSKNDSTSLDISGPGEIS